MTKTININAAAENIAQQVFDKSMYGVNDVLLNAIQDDVVSAIEAAIDEGDNDVADYVEDYFVSIAEALQQVDYQQAVQDAS